MSKRSLNNVREVLALSFVSCLVEEGINCSSMSGSDIVEIINDENILRNYDNESAYDIIQRRYDVFGDFEIDFILATIEEFYESSFYEGYEYVGCVKKC